MSLANGTAVYLSKTKANVLNGGGIVTALNFNGWRLWGNRTSIYAYSSDPKDNFIPCRRMMNFVGNQLAVNYFSDLDMPTNKRNIEKVLDKVGMYLNGLKGRGALLGGRIAFLPEDNPVTELADGKLRFQISLGLIPPARSITFTLSFDINYLNNLFS